MSFEVRAIREEEREECIALWCTIWPGDSDPYFRKYFFGDVEWLPYYTQVGVLDARLVSAAHVCKRVVACGDVRLTMGALANVVTLPEYRGKGYNTQCLRRAIEIMEADAMDFSFLGTGINAYYERLGYATVPMPWASGTLEPTAPTPQAFQTRPASAADVLRIRDLYAQYNRHRPIAVERSAAYWRDWVGVSEAADPADTLVAVDANGQVQGYVRTGVFLSAVPYSEGAVGQRATEIGVADEVDKLDCTQALLAGVAADLTAGQEFRLAIGLEPEVLTVIDSMLTDVRYQNDLSMMARLLHPDNLFRSLTPGWNERWIVAGRPAGQLSFATPYGAVALDAHGAFLKVTASAPSPQTLSQAAFFGLLFGLIDPATVAVAPSQIPLLQALFPRQAAVFYGADGF